jgi:hypothetical protein
LVAGEFLEKVSERSTCIAERYPSHCHESDPFRYVGVAT